MYKVAVHVILRRDERIFLIRRAGTGWMDGYFTVIAGHLESDESLRQAAVREAREEAGIEIETDALNFSSTIHRRKEDGESRLDIFFDAARWTGEPENNEPDKCDLVGWYDLQELPKNMVEYVRRGLEAYAENIKYLEVGWNKRHEI